MSWVKTCEGWWINSDRFREFRLYRHWKDDTGEIFEVTGHYGNFTEIRIGFFLNIISAEIAVKEIICRPFAEFDVAHTLFDIYQANIDKEVIYSQLELIKLKKELMDWEF